MERLTEAEFSLLADDAWEFVQEMAARGYRYAVVRLTPEPHISIGQSSLLLAPDILRACADEVEAKNALNAKRVN